MYFQPQRYSKKQYRTSTPEQKPTNEINQQRAITQNANGLYSYDILLL